MPILRKFGRSETNLETRTLALGARRSDEQGKKCRILEFLISDPEALLGQWASMMDKIASKPRGQGKPSSHQRAFREALGSAIWEDLTGSEGPFAELDEVTREALHRKWSRRMHPYPEGEITGDNQASPKGRLYTMFAGEIGFGKADKPTIARKIRKHLLESELRNAAGDCKRGHAVRRGNSMEKNVLAKPRKPLAPSWSEEDIPTYRSKGDVAAAIRDAAREAEEEERKVGWRLAAVELFAQYGRVFAAPNGVKTFDAAEREQPGLLALHRAIEGLYRQRLKRHRKDPRLHGGAAQTPEDRVSRTLPADFDALLAALGHAGRNRDIATLIRKGRILHYQASRNAADTARTGLIDNQPVDLPASHFWTSDGQTEIKRSEIFVRIWMRALAHANRTLADWLTPGGEATDITWLR